MRVLRQAASTWPVSFVGIRPTAVSDVQLQNVQPSRDIIEGPLGHVMFFESADENLTRRSEPDSDEGGIEEMNKIEKCIQIEPPVRVVYDQWTQFEEFPKFMEGVKFDTYNLSEKKEFPKDA